MLLPSFYLLSLLHLTTAILDHTFWIDESCFEVDANFRDSISEAQSWAASAFIRLRDMQTIPDQDMANAFKAVFKTNWDDSTTYPKSEMWKSWQDPKTTPMTPRQMVSDAMLQVASLKEIGDRATSNLRFYCDETEILVPPNGGDPDDLHYDFLNGMESYLDCGDEDGNVYGHTVTHMMAGNYSPSRRQLIIFCYAQFDRDFDMSSSLAGHMSQSPSLRGIDMEDLGNIGTVTVLHEMLHTYGIFLDDKPTQVDGAGSEGTESSHSWHHVTRLTSTADAVIDAECHAMFAMICGLMNHAPLPGLASGGWALRRGYTDLSSPTSYWPNNNPWTQGLPFAYQDVINNYDKIMAEFGLMPPIATLSTRSVVGTELTGNLSGTLGLARINGSGKFLGPTLEHGKLVGLAKSL